MQSYFERFHQAILLTDSEHYQHVRVERDAILEQVRQHVYRQHHWTFQPNNYGSYAMGTGIRPLPGKEYDVDVGLIFNLRPELVSAVTIKSAVFDALNAYKPLWQRPCLTVVRPGFHLDLSVCAKEGERLWLAEGKQHDHRSRWRPDGMAWLVTYVQSFPSTTHNPQFLRVIRYLKRWKDVHFSYDGAIGPVGLALTGMALRWFQPQPGDDLSALIVLVRQVVAHFNAGHTTLEFPYEPRDNLLRKMSQEQIRQLRDRFRILLQGLEEAQRQNTVTPLSQAFGADFTVPKAPVAPVVVHSYDYYDDDDWD